MLSLCARMSTVVCIKSHPLLKGEIYYTVSNELYQYDTLSATNKDINGVSGKPRPVAQCERILEELE